MHFLVKKNGSVHVFCTRMHAKLAALLLQLCWERQLLQLCNIRWRHNSWHSGDIRRRYARVLPKHLQRVSHRPTHTGTFTPSTRLNVQHTMHAA